MKKVFFLGLSLLLCASLLAGCRGNREPMDTTGATMAPTMAPTTVPATMPTTAPSETTLPTTGTMPSETIDRGNGPVDGTDSTTGSAPAAEGRSISPTQKGR